MENAHLRLGLLEYVRITEKTSTRIRLRVDRYMGEDRQAHLLSVFGNDSDVGAITAAVHEKAAFSLTFPGWSDQGSLARRTCLLLQRARLLCQAGNTQCVIYSRSLRNCTPTAPPEELCCCATGARRRGPRL